MRGGRGSNDIDKGRRSRGRGTNGGEAERRGETTQERAAPSGQGAAGAASELRASFWTSPAGNGLAITAKITARPTSHERIAAMP